MLLNYFKIAFRQLWRNRLYSLLNGVGLAVGMACCLLIALYVYDEWHYDRFHTNFEHIYRITEKQKQAEGIFDVAVTPGPLAPALAKDFPDVQATTRVGRWPGLLTQGTRTVELEYLLIVDPGFFSVFSFGLVAGNAATVFRNPNEVILTEATAERFFGANWRSRNVLGQVITLNQKSPLTVVGVARNPPANSSISFEALLPFKWLEQNDEWSMKWNSNSYHTYVQVRPSPAGVPADPLAFGEKIRNRLKVYDKDNETQLLLQPLSAIYLRSNFAFETDWGNRSDIAYVRMFVTVGLIVLLIAIINFVNLATARASKRAKEVGVRKAVGSRRAGLMAQFLSEALLMTCLSVAVALLLAELLLPLFNNLADKAIRIPYGQASFWLVVGTLTLGVAGLTGLYPAFFLSSFRPAVVLRGGSLGNVAGVSAGRGFRQSLVVGQFALAILLMIGAVVIYQQLTFIQNKRLGFDKEQLLYVRLKGDLKFKALAFKKQVEPLPGVLRASVTTANLVDMNNGTTIEWEGQTPKDEFSITQMNVDPDFMATTGMELASGRTFSSLIPSDTASALGTYLINETAAKRMGWTPATALGKRVKFWGTWGRIIGVLKDFHFRPLRVTIEPFIFRYQPRTPYFTLLVKVQPGSTTRTIADIANVYKRVDPTNPLAYGFVDSDLDAQYRSEQRTGRIILYFSVLTILISCLGLFGLATFTAEQRTKEIGVRKVLGASIVSIVSLLSKDFLKLVLVAIVIATPLAWYATHRWLQDFAYKIDIEWWYFASAGLLAVGIALLTVSFQSVKAALMNPVKSLRSE